MQIDEIPTPEGSLIAEYARRAGHYTDCFETPVAVPVLLPDFITAFYTQPLFRAERVVLRLLARTPSTDAEVAALATGQGDTFAVWRLEARRDDQILLAERSGRTLSWLQAAPDALRFGSVVVPVPGRGGAPTLGPVFQSLAGAHKVYSRALLSGAARRVTR
ncbi:hypothetical protein [uncultured Tateyamaria sp.]|uniref:hypothetical protein n=1 Tax=uncultured Tateyamaria sp. TaxID=455651 RepID=UPI002607B252|nr:hypothetical protein [uncultured Tateyamaria sp.]